MRNWNSVVFSATPLEHPRFYFTYEELKQSFPCFFSKSNKHSFYFTYEELKLWWFIIAFRMFWVFTLPMRNWNKEFLEINLQGYRSFYFTYEELKLSISFTSHTIPARFYFTYEELKPFRSKVRYFKRHKFLLYLWGIETTSW